MKQEEVYEDIFDMNIYNRIFDDQTQLRIRFESMAIDILFELVEKKKNMNQSGLLYWNMKIVEILLQKESIHY